MLSRVSKYLVPFGVAGTAALCTTSKPLFASCEENICRSDPCSVYSEPKRDLCACPPPERECKDTELERLVMRCRTDLGPLKANMDTYTKQARCHMISAYGTVKDNVCYLRTRAPDEVRVGTIVAGGLFGALLGFRRGLFRKLLFGTLGAGAAAYLVYPEETTYSFNNGVPIVKKYAMVAYNFATGGTDCPAKPSPPKCPPKKDSPTEQNTESTESTESTIKNLNQSCPAVTLKQEKADRNIRSD